MRGLRGPCKRITCRGDCALRFRRELKQGRLALNTSYPQAGMSGPGVDSLG